MQANHRFSTPFPKLDDALGNHLSAGQFILCAGLTGNGKTVLAGQLAAHFALANASVLFASTEVGYQELLRRIISASSSIGYDLIKDRMDVQSIDLSSALTLQVPDSTTYGIEAASKGFKVLLALSKHATFTKIESLGYNPGNELNDILEFHCAEKGTRPDVIIYDYLDYPQTCSKEIDIFKMRNAVIEAAKAFRSTARERNILVIAFCQADPGLTQSRKITPDGIAEFKSVGEYADAFIGISHRRRPDDDTSEGGVYQKIQHLSVTSKTRPTTKMVPVERDFKFQRFAEPRWRPHTVDGEDLRESDPRARHIEKASEFPGYVLARRQKFYKIFECGLPYAINLYAFLLLVTALRGPCTGCSFYSRQALSDRLCLSVKRLRTAMDFLIEGEWIKVPKARFKQSLRYEILDWKRDQDPEQRGYFKLFRNLRDAHRADLLGDPVLFRVWLYLLTEARSFPEETLELNPGDLLLRPRHAAEKLGIKKQSFDAQIDKLKTRGSVEFYHHDPNLLKIVNWDLYQTRVHPSTGRSNAESEM